MDFMIATDQDRRTTYYYEIGITCQVDCTSRIRGLVPQCWGIPASPVITDIRFQSSVSSFVAHRGTVILQAAVNWRDTVITY
eukprot:746660-Hanusia_phi.AAC.1